MMASGSKSWSFTELRQIDLQYEHLRTPQQPVPEHCPAATSRRCGHPSACPGLCQHFGRIPHRTSANARQRTQPYQVAKPYLADPGRARRKVPRSETVQAERCAVGCSVLGRMTCSAAATRGSNTLRRPYCGVCTLTDTGGFATLHRRRFQANDGVSRDRGSRNGDPPMPDLSETHSPRQNRLIAALPTPASERLFSTP